MRNSGFELDEAGSIATGDSGFCLLAVVYVLGVGLDAMLESAVAFGHHVVGILQAKRLL